jgi:hypothetical protein
VKRAYKRARTSDFTEWLQDQYRNEELKCNPHHDAGSIKQAKEAAKEEVAAAREAAKEEVAVAREEVAAIQTKSIAVMLQAGIQADIVATGSGIPLHEAEVIRAANAGWSLLLQARCKSAHLLRVDWSQVTRARDLPFQRQGWRRRAVDFRHARSTSGMPPQTAAGACRGDSRPQATAGRR